ncbi:hypothetical protein Pmani_022189 [Petrolisthes manimaculis]|uniref:Uncharacterized protein n=1 Tax=Petrolisthes manimaculis TaxID=1843537 RepID=A0AAE1PCL3_9EUCA|nr:hypothetical protein Pmani_022189 [Petrolisthes manimaculis]
MLTFVSTRDRISVAHPTLLGTCDTHNAASSSSTMSKLIAAARRTPAPGGRGNTRIHPCRGRAADCSAEAPAATAS